MPTPAGRRSSYDGGASHTRTYSSSVSRLSISQLTEPSHPACTMQAWRSHHPSLKPAPTLYPTWFRDYPCSPVECPGRGDDPPIVSDSTEQPAAAHDERDTDEAPPRGWPTQAVTLQTPPQSTQSPQDMNEDLLFDAQDLAHTVGAEVLVVIAGTDGIQSFATPTFHRLERATAQYLDSTNTPQCPPESPGGAASSAHEDRSHIEQKPQ